MDAKELKKQLLREKKSKNILFLKNKLREGKLLIGGTKCNEEYFRKLIVFLKKTVLVYKDNWDLFIEISNFKSEDNYTLNIAGIGILFKDLTITNTVGGSHRIKDLLVMVGFTVDSFNTRLILNRPKGKRLTLDKKEYEYNRWSHPHLNTPIEGSFKRTDLSLCCTSDENNFCLGTGPIIETLNNITALSITPESAQNFLLNLFALASHESLEGGPYNSISNLYSSRTNNYYYFRGSTLLDTELYDYILYKIRTDNIKVPFKIINNKIGLEDTFVEKIILKCLYELIDYKRGVPTNKVNYALVVNLVQANLEERYLCYIRDGVYFKFVSKVKNAESGDLVTENISEDTYIFNGEEDYIKVQYNPKEYNSGENIDYTVHPNLIKVIKQNLLNYATNKLIKKIGSIRYSDTCNNS